MQIIAGSSSKLLAQKIAQNTGYELLNSHIGKFRDGELHVEIQEHINEDVVIVQSTSPPVNDNLMELLLLGDIVKRAGVKNITAIIPYFGYSRQDRLIDKNKPISASLVIRLLECAGVTRIITLDLHSEQLEGDFGIPIVNINPATLFVPFYKDEADTVIVSPDKGSITRSQGFSSRLDKDLVVINKTRHANNECSMRIIIGQVKNKKCVIIDDIIDSASTLCKAATLLKENGATNISAFITHPVLSGNAKEKIMNTPIDKVIVSDSIYHTSLPNKFLVVPVDKLIIKKLNIVSNV